MSVTLTDNEIKLKAVIVSGVPKDMTECCDTILADNPDDTDALYVKGLAECILGDFQEATTIWSKIDRINPNLYDRDCFADAVTRKFIRNFATCMDGTGLGMYECTKVALNKAEEDIELYRVIFKRLDDKIFPNRVEIFLNGQVKHGNTKYVKSLSDFVISSFDSITDIDQQIELLQLCADHIRYVNTNSDIPLFKIVIIMHEYIISELSTCKKAFTAEQLKQIEEKRKGEPSLVPLLLKARECQTDRMSLIDVKKKRVPKDAQKNIKKYTDSYFVL